VAATKLTAWAAKREGTLNKFYTRSDVGDLLSREIGAVEPLAVIDLGAGEGSLASAIARRWPKASVTTVDVDPSCIDDLHTSLTIAGCRNHEHRTLDVLKADLPSEFAGYRFDLAICNPPFYRPHWKREFADILRDADLVDACPTVPEATAEILFLAQCLRLLKTGGTIALIIPDGLATGWRAVAFRRALLRQHTLRTVVQLPPNSFFDTEAYCFILILDKGQTGSDLPVKLLRLDDSGTISDSIFVSALSAEARFDYAYHSVAQSSPLGATSLRQLGAEVRRGSLSTVERKSAGMFVFHTGDFPKSVQSVCFGTEIPYSGVKNMVVAESGDILMARVDRELHDKITIVETGKFAITDCVYRIRLPEQHRRRVFDALTSKDGRERIRAATKGVGARLLGKGELLDLPLSF
jgi:type I restriction enzyme M protein